MALSWLAEMGDLPKACVPPLPSPLPISAPSPAASPTLAVPKTPSWCEQGTDPLNPSLACQHVPCGTQPSWGEELMPLRYVGLACGGHNKARPGGQAEACRLFPNDERPGAARLEHPQGVRPRCSPV